MSWSSDFLSHCLHPEESRKFQLSHRAPVEMPLETAASLDAGFLTRHLATLTEVVFFNNLQTPRFVIMLHVKLVILGCIPHFERTFEPRKAGET